MIRKNWAVIAVCTGLFAFGVAVFSSVGQAGEDKKKTEKKVEKKAEKKKEVWTDSNDKTLPIDFKIQGEYVGEKIGAQVIALGGGTFQAVVYIGGLPGAGWNGKDRSLLEGKLEGDKAVFTAAQGKRNYLAQAPTAFSATAKFPPVGHQESLSATIASEKMSLKGKESIELKRTVRTSPTLGAKAPSGAVILFDGSSKDEFNGGRLDKVTGLLNTDGSDVTTKRKFSNYTAHVEFLLPYRPDARGQGRGNSGFYQVDHYEVQILDSFGLEGKDNECGGVYQRLNCKVNMCLPPLQWQTYDVEFTNAVAENGKVTKKARLTLKHNGVIVHDNAEIVGVTGGARKEPEGTPGLLRLQGHGNPLQFRNIWVVENK